MSSDPVWHSVMFDQYAHVFDVISEHRADTGALSEFLLQTLPQSAFSFPLLDAGCGTGRHSASLAKLSPLVIGVDKSRAMLAIAHTKNVGIPNCIYLQDDFRSPQILPNQFGVILKCYTSVGYFPTSTELDIATRFHDMLRSGGYCVLDTFNGSWLSRAGHHVRHTSLSGIELQETYRYSSESGKCHCNWCYIAGGKEVASIDFDLDLYSHDRMRDLLKLAGFVDIQVYSGYTDCKHRPTDSTVERLVCVGRKE